MDRSGCSKCITIDHSRYTAFYNVVSILVQFVVFGLLSIIFLNIVHLVAGVSSKNFAKVLLFSDMTKKRNFQLLRVKRLEVLRNFRKLILAYKMEI